MKKLVALVAAIFAALALTSSTHTIRSAPEALAMPPIPMRQIPQLVCENMLGTGIVIDEHTIVTANHVITANNECEIRRNSSLLRSASQPLTVQSRDPEYDFALLSARGYLPRPAIRISCDPMVTGETYWMIGYSLGEPVLDIHAGVALPNYYGGRSPDGYVVKHLRGVDGVTYTGMSGGPVLNSDGEAVGFVSAKARDIRNRALIREFADTPLCRRSDK